MRARQSLQRRSALRRGALPAVAILFYVSSAAAQLDAADGAYDGGRIAEAGRAYEDALATGELDPRELARAHTRLGVISALGGDFDRMERHFAIALSIDPTLAPPAELDGARRARFEELRGDRAMVRIERRGSEIAIDVEGAHAELARTIEARGRGWTRRFPWEGSPLTIAPPSSALPLEVRLLDGYGNVAARVEIALPPAEPIPRTEGDDFIESPWLWIAIGLIVLGAGIAIGVSASGDRWVLGAPVIR